MPTNVPSPFSRQLDAEIRRLRGQVRAGWTDVARDADLRTRAGWALVLRRIGPKRLLLGLGGLALLVFLFVPTGESADPFDGPAGAIDLFLKLGIVVALAYASLAVLKRYTVGATRATSLLQVLDSTTLAPNRSVYVVRVGEKRLVLGVTQNQISTLAELEPEAPSASLAPGDVVPRATATVDTVVDTVPDEPVAAVHRAVTSPTHQQGLADRLADADPVDDVPRNGLSTEALPPTGHPRPERC
jgi:flagellar biosynthetic protein FliO